MTKKLQILGSLGNSDADTLDGKHASEFASASDVETLKSQVGDTSVSEQVEVAISNLENLAYINEDDVATSTGKITNLFADKAKTIPAFPRTKIKAVSDDNGVGLDAILNDLNVTLDEKLSKVLTSDMYGTTLPSSAPVGRIFFKKVT